MRSMTMYEEKARRREQEKSEQITQLRDKATQVITVIIIFTVVYPRKY